MIQEYIEGQVKSLTSQSKQDIGIGAFLLFARVSDSSKYKATIPIYALEDGSYANDHIINSPLEITISGEVSDIHIKPTTTTALQNRITSQVGSITKYAPTRTATQISRINALANDIQDGYRAIDSAIEDGKQAYNFFGNKANTAKGLREQFIDYIESVYYGKQLLTIEMPFRNHADMSIVDLTIDRNNQDEVLRFTIKAQKVIFSKVAFSTLDNIIKNPSSAVKNQLSKVKDKGSQKPAKQKSLLSFGLSLF